MGLSQGFVRFQLPSLFLKKRNKESKSERAPCGYIDLGAESCADEPQLRQFKK